MKTGLAIDSLQNFLTAERTKMNNGNATFKVIYLTTHGKDGYPHITLLSVGELKVQRLNDFLFCIHNVSTATQNLLHYPQAIFSFVSDGMHHVIKLNCRLMSSKKIEDLELSFFTGSIMGDRSNEVEYAELSASSEFKLILPDKSISRWTKQWSEMEQINKALIIE